MSWRSSLALAFALAGCTTTMGRAPRERPEAPTPTPDASSGVPQPPRGRWLQSMTWIEAEAVLGPETIVVLPLGAAAKEHGPHLLLENDWLLAEYFADRVYQAADVVIAPILSYHHYPAFAEYPGSTSLSAETARDVVVDIVRSLARFGPRRFYVLNTGISTVDPLRASAQVLRAEGILLHFTDIQRIAGPVEARIAEQEGGTHADEIETSMMLYIAPQTVDMRKAVKDYAPKTRRGFSRTPDGPGHFSKSGVFGDPTLATRAKGEQIVEAMVAGILDDLATLRREKPPKVR